jgi:hypothetical protein
MLDEALRCGLSQAQELAGKEGIQMISKVKGGYQAKSSNGKNLAKSSNGKNLAKSSNGKNLGGPYKTSTAAKKRLRQVEFFKRQKG